MFKWICFAAACLISAVLVWMVNDLRIQVRKSVVTLNEDLPQILEQARESTATMATLSKDLQQLRELVVGNTPGRESNLIAYETEVLRLIENSNGKIGFKKTLGSGLSDPVPAKEWVTRERKVALWDQARSRSKSDLLNRIGRSAVLNRVWYIDKGEKTATPLVDWVKANLPEASSEETDPVSLDASKP